MSAIDRSGKVSVRNFRCSRQRGRCLDRSARFLLAELSRRLSKVVAKAMPGSLAWFFEIDDVEKRLRHLIAVDREKKSMARA